ncbi:MAG TPA: hypothetical protein VN904_00540 [Chthoniobacterales bacterium]|nr:hypothetical protein [Chthoniobacterales bacterium]
MFDRKFIFLDKRLPMPEVAHEKKYETVVSSGQSALKALLTMNGGASIAFLAFIGNAIKERAIQPEAGGILINAMQFFIAGTFATVCAFGTIFLTNCFSSIQWSKTRNWMFGVTLTFGFFSLGFFVWASWRAIQGFTAASHHIFGD